MPVSSVILEFARFWNKKWFPNRVAVSEAACFLFFAHPCSFGSTLPSGFFKWSTILINLSSEIILDVDF